MTNKQKKFVENYLKTMNAAQAAKLAGYEEKSAKSQGYKLRQIPEIKEAIEKGIEEIFNSLEIDKEFVLLKLRKLSEYGQNETIQLRALELIGKHLNLFSERKELEITCNTAKIDELLELI